MFFYGTTLTFLSVLVSKVNFPANSLTCRPRHLITFRWLDCIWPFLFGLSQMG